MRTLIVLILSCGVLNAETYIYIMDKEKNTQQAIKTFVASAEMKSNQSHQNTSVVDVSDKYGFIFFTPKNGEDFKLEEKVSGVELYKMIELNEDGFFKTTLDNSWLYPTYEVPISSK